MKTTALILSVIILSCLLSPKLSIAGKYGFGELNFGDSKETVINYLKKTYTEENILDSNKYVWLNNFKIGDMVVDVTFSFDNNDVLYSFQFESEKVSASEFGDKLNDDVLYLSRVFINKYGTPYKKNKISLTSVDSNSVSYFGKWNNKEYDIYTGISSYEFQYYAIANVTSKKMEKAFELYNKKQKIQSSKEAVNSF